MPDEYRALIADLAAEHADLDSVVASLSEAEWSILTPADGWTVRDSILHLALTDEVAALAAGDPVGFERYHEQRRAGVDPFQSRRGMPADELLDLWRTNRARLLEALEAVDSRARVTWFGPPLSAMSHATARLMETWAHGQDVVDALGVERKPTARLRHIAHLGVRTRAYSYQQHGLTPPTTDLEVRLIAPDGAVWTWSSSSATPPEHTGSDAAPGIDRVSGPVQDFCLIVVRRRHLDDTGVRAEGPHAREWVLMAQAFAGASGPGRQPGQFPARGEPRC